MVSEGGLSLALPGQRPSSAQDLPPLRASHGPVRAIARCSHRSPSVGAIVLAGSLMRRWQPGGRSTDGDGAVLRRSSTGSTSAGAPRSQSGRPQIADGWTGPVLAPGGSALRRMRIVPVAVPSSDLPVSVVDQMLGLLAPRGVASRCLRLRLRREVLADSRRTLASVGPTVAVRNRVDWWLPRHCKPLLEPGEPWPRVGVSVVRTSTAPDCSTRRLPA